MNRIPPHEPEAELSLLGAAMLGSAALETAVTMTQTTDYYLPVHQVIHMAMTKLYRGGIVLGDPLLVWDELQSMGEHLESVGGPAYLTEIMGKCPSTSNAPRYASLVVDAAMMRDLIRVGTEVTNLGFESSDAAFAIDNAKSMLGSLDLNVGKGELSPDLATFLATEVEYDWLVPGLIERQDRLLLTGGEGKGKSTWFRQIAMCLAAGIHPFRFHPVPACRVLLVDIENTAAQVQRKLRPMYEMVQERMDPDNLHIIIKTGGIDVTTRLDHRCLVEQVAAVGPDLLIIGPVYKLHTGDPNDEGPARHTISVLDSLRERFGCALFMEAHSPHGNASTHGGRPFGASIWKRWPEFGYGIWPVPGDESGAVGFTPWRGARDARDWPERLVRGGPGEWPWLDPDVHAPDERF